MKLPILFAWAALVSPLFSQAELPAAKLLDRVISAPGSYAQVCDVMTMPEDLPYQAFELTDFAGAWISKGNLAAIQSNREGLVKAIRARLLEVDFAKEPVEPKKDATPEESSDGEDVGCDPMTLNPLLLNVILELKAVEALPELLVVEQKLVKGIAVAKDDVKAKPPIVSGWFVGVEGVYDENEDQVKRDRRLDLFQARVAQRDLVMTMALLMRGKAYKPYLATAIEAKYAKGLKEVLKKHGLENYKQGDAMPVGMSHLEMRQDPITKLWIPSYAPVKIPYTRESRDEVRAAAAKWISENP